MKFKKLNEKVYIDLEAEIAQILAELGIPDHIKAHAYLKELILTAVNDPGASTPDERLAREDNVTKQFVHNAIRDALGTYLSRNYKSILSDHFGHPVQNERARPTAEELVEMIAANLRPKLSMGLVRTEEEAKRDLHALDAMCRELEKSHGLREYWAAAVYYGEMTADQAVKAQEENDKAFARSLQEEPKFMTIED